ncbi:fusaric acid transporter [Stenotrophomonas maltophilia]|uniref:FUSC family protein n=3 Tax=Lysobacteraceae TaxID=32033 RepID=A0A2J0SMD8_STEMA|nr:FUSC family protein [Stenotrophomonas maltophilia]MBH1866801.1 FUSC family protein [Stenotrophomonas maltophilia]PJK98453.1 fusaric acid transporter [Stenotrophomonas maltophilia]PJL26482.1 fusaric acid transporter [Stenotrophomonas maltophilia]PJL64560.1 fusaric acid transporter [Stenotrophomonas maltophilia]
MRQAFARLKSPALRTDQEAVLFSLKCLLAASLGLYVSLRIGLNRPFWVIGTVYLVSQPLSGATLSRGLFRLLGTVGGAFATVALVPRFANAPLVLSAALAAWMALCLYLAMLDRTPRAYAFLLAGYTTSLIGFPAVMVPGDVFTIAITRVQEIAIGILAATLVHGLVLPRRVSMRVHARVAAVLDDTERWTRDMRAGASDTVLATDRSKVAADLLELHVLSIHLPFDSAHGVAQVQILRALHDRMLDVLMLSSAVEDSIDRLRSPQMDSTGWRNLLQAGLAAQQTELDLAHADCRVLQAQLRTARSDWRRHVPARLVRHAQGAVLHRDHRLALRSALGAFVGILLSCVLWIATGWSEGATAVSIIGTACVLFGTIEAPAPHVMRYLVGSCIGVAVGLLYGLLIFPALSDITGLIAALAPVLLLCGSFLARPPFIMAALGVVLTFPLIAGLGATSTVNIVGALNNSVALFVGTTVALCSMQLFQTADAGRNRARLERSIRRDIARHAAGQGDVTRAWLSRMLDRIGLLAPRLQGRASAAHDLRALFADVRAAHASNQLRALDTRLHDPRTQAFHAALIEHVAAHFRIRAHAARSVDTHLLELLDRMRETAAASSGAEQEHLSHLLCGLRRDLLVSPLTHRH